MNTNTYMNTNAYIKVDDDTNIKVDADNDTTNTHIKDNDDTNIKVDADTNIKVDTNTNTNFDNTTDTKIKDTNIGDDTDTKVEDDNDTNDTNKKRLTPDEAISILNKISGYKKINVYDSSLTIDTFVLDQNSKIYDIAKYRTPYGWESIFQKCFKEFKVIDNFLQIDEEKHGKCIPLRRNIFKAFTYTPPRNVKVVILGNEPYGNGQGLAYSVDYDDFIPETLNYIYNELIRDPLVEFTRPNHGNLITWALQGVLLLNTCLTKRKNGTHIYSSTYSIWTGFVEKILSSLIQYNKKIIFVLWGKSFKKYIPILGNATILESSYPDKYGSRYGFYGCSHFSQINQQLTTLGLDPIDWNIPPLDTSNQS